MSLHREPTAGGVRFQALVLPPFGGSVFFQTPEKTVCLLVCLSTAKQRVPKNRGNVVGGVLFKVNKGSRLVAVGQAHPACLGA